MRRTSPLLKLFYNTRNHTNFHQHNFWPCGTCKTSVIPPKSGLVYGCACSYSSETGGRGRIRRPKRFDDTGSAPVAPDPAITHAPYSPTPDTATVKGRSPIVQQNWDKHYEALRRTKKAKEEWAKSHGNQAASASFGTARTADNYDDDDEDDVIEEKQESKPTDPADEFGSLTIGDTKLRANDPHSKMTQEQLDELKSNIYTIDQNEEEGDSRVVPEDLSDRMNFRQLKIKTKALMNTGQLPQALDLFTHAMKAGGFRYDMQDLSHTYTELIWACGHAGHVKMALQLFTDMKKRGCYVKPSIYTNLFNAFANSVGDREKNLEKLERIKENMLDKGFIPNIIHYHALIKAYGRLGQIQAAFATVDELIQRSLADPLPKARKPKLTTETFNFLLSACISDKENGFRHSLITWKKMIDMKIAPDHYSFKLFLRSVRECGIVVPKSVRKLLGESNSYTSNELPVSETGYLVAAAEIEDPEKDGGIVPPMVQSESGFDDNCALILTDLVEGEGSSMISSGHIQAQDNPGGSELLNLLRNSCTPARGVQELLRRPNNRLAMLGGFKAVVAEMRNFNVKPDLKTVTELVQIINLNEVQDLVHFMSLQNVKPDADFYNLMIKRHIMWGQIEQARSVLKLMQRSRLHPNVMTWGIFSMACKDWKTGKRLLKDIDSYKMEPNIQIVGGLLGNAVRNFDPRYVLRVMEELKLRRLDPDAKFVERVRDFRTVVQKGLVNWEQGLEVTPLPLQTQLKENYEDFINQYTKFKLRYHTWMKAVPESVLAKVRNPEEVADPWEEDFRARLTSLKKAQQN